MEIGLTRKQAQAVLDRQRHYDRVLLSKRKSLIAGMRANKLNHTRLALTTLVGQLERGFAPETDAPLSGT